MLPRDSAKKDSVRCFFCGGSLHDWEATDDPWVAHAKSFPMCGFVVQSLGKNFSDTVQRMVHVRNKNNPMSFEIVVEEMKVHPSNFQNRPTGNNDQTQEGAQQKDLNEASEYFKAFKTC
ncbi:hypothetical protein RRG08_004441 [Elysia crispata]|uniref:Uncharacterized protein n=1 Tax=Elysia crispata TaxID=231223 RepID=A0AAE1APM8_9GAST|nr:hypothetical protein RRG08_004441 [Elysia crispata]